MSEEHYGRKHIAYTTASLLTSVSTLACCALPALLVTIGAGASLASLISSAPWLVALSKYKVWTFGISGLLLAVAGVVSWRARQLPCPIDPEQAKACSRLRKINTGIFAASVVIWCVGFFFAFIAVYFL